MHDYAKQSVADTLGGKDTMASVVIQCTADFYGEAQKMKEAHGTDDTRKIIDNGPGAMTTAYGRGADARKVHVQNRARPG